MREPATRHRRDVVSLVMGLLLLAVAGLFLLVDLADRAPDMRWAGPLVLIGIGVVGLAASVRRRDPR
jgi:hypothetical protein